MRPEDLLEIGESGPLPLVGLGLITVAVPYFVPSLRPELGGILKASAKLFLEAEFGADNQLTDRLVDKSVDALMRMMPDATDEEHERHADRELDRFFSRARSAARRRGFNPEDAERRYNKHLSRMERGLTGRKHAGTGRPQTLEHALRRIANEPRTGVGEKRKA